MSRPERRRIRGKGLAPNRVKPKRSTPRRRDAPRWGTEQWDEASMLLAARSRGMCEVCGDLLGAYTERHHRQRRRDGGDRLANLLMIHSRCHAWITDNPESLTKARANGWIVSALGIASPESLPVLLWGSTWVVLDDTGKATACDPPR